MDKYTFMQRIGVINVAAITARAPSDNWGWWNYGNHILFWGKRDWERCIGIIYSFVEGSGDYEMFGCGYPANPPAFDECIIFTDKDNNYIDDQDDDKCTRALGHLPRGGGRLDGMEIAPSAPGPWTGIEEYTAPLEPEQYAPPPVQYDAVPAAVTSTGLIVAAGAVLGAMGLAYAALQWM